MSHSARGGSGRARPRRRPASDDRPTHRPPRDEPRHDPDRGHSSSGALRPRRLLSAMARSLNMTFGVWKPWFLYRLRQIVRRLLSAVRPPSSTSGTVDTSWGGRVIVDRTRAIRRDNDGMAMLADGGPASVQAVQVVVERLDDLIDTGASMLKLDVEGFEA